MVEIRFSQSAWDDLDSITEYIAKDSVRYTQEFGIKVFDRIEQLQEFPYSGRIVPEFNNENLRELMLGKYRIVYRIYQEDLIIVLRIVHGAKLIL